MTRSLMPLDVLEELCNYKLTPNCQFLDADEMLSVGDGSRLAPNDRLCDANGNAQRALWLETGLE